MSKYEYKHWCGNCQIRIYEQRHYGKILTWQDCPYTCDYAIAMRCSTEAKAETIDHTSSKQAASRCDYWDSESNFCSLYRPSAEKQGWWISQEYMSEIDSFIYTEYKCSNCGEISKKKSKYCPNCGKKMDENVQLAGTIKENKMNDDTISRQAVLNLIIQCAVPENGDSLLYQSIKQLPSTERQARWKKCKKNLFFPDDDIFTCSECFHNYFKQTNYCPNCGAQMEVE